MATAGVIPRLAPGFVSIYGTPSIYGFTLPPNSRLAFGVVYDTGQNSQGAYAVGQNVLLPYLEADQLIYKNQTYWLIDQSKIILVEVAPDTAPAP